jgi:phosphoglycolate phosphatase
MAEGGTRFESVLFDLDGTLTDPRVAITTSMVYALRELGATAPAADELTWCIGPPLRENFAKLLGASRGDLVERAAQIYLRRYATEGVRETVVYPGIDTMLRKLSTRAKLYLATSKFVDHAEQVLRGFSLRQYFAGAFGSQRDGSMAAKTDLVRFILKTEKLSPDRAVIIGDREHDIIGGKANGVFTIGVTYGYGSRAELERAGTDEICQSPAEITSFIEPFLEL